MSGGGNIERVSGNHPAVGGRCVYLVIRHKEPQYDTQGVEKTCLLLIMVERGGKERRGEERGKSE